MSETSARIMLSLYADPFLAASSFLIVILLLSLYKFFHKLWWTPISIQKKLASQGINGPRYKFVDGNSKEIAKMRAEAMKMPKNLSHDIFSQVQPHTHSWRKIYGKNFLQWYGSQAQLFIMDPEMCKEILNNKDRTFNKREPQRFVKKLIGDGLAATTDAEKWGKVRKIANHAFHGESLKSMIPIMIASSDAMLERWKKYEGNEIEVIEEFRLLTSEVISKTAFGSSYLEGQNIFEMLMKLYSLIFRNFFTVQIPIISKFYKPSDELEAEKLEKGIHDCINEIVNKREKEESFGSDFLGLLLKAHHDCDESQRISVDDLVDECKTFYFAGQETTNALLGWTVFLLAHHSDWQDKARKEVMQVFGHETPNPDGIAKLKTMGMIINESLRLYPPIVSITRKVKNPVRLGEVMIPANVEVNIPTLALHHEPQLWGEEAEMFKPERFAEGVAKATSNNQGIFLPFGMGPRKCVGFDYATIEAKITLAMILQRYEFTLSQGYVHSPFHYLTLRPQHGIQVILHSIK